MRVAISAMAGVSGLLLLVLAFYGQPAAYLREVQDQWDELMDRPVADRPAATAGDAGIAPNVQPKIVTTTPARRSEPTGPQPFPAAPSAPAAPVPRLPASQPAPEEARPFDAPSLAASPPLPSAASPPVLPDMPHTSPPGPRVASPPAPASPPMPLVQVPERHEAGVEQGTPPPPLAKAEPSGPEAAKPEPPDRAGEQARSEQSKSEAQKPEPSKSQPPKTEPPKSEVAKSEPAKPDAAKSEPANPDQSKPEPSRPSKVAVALKPVPTPPPLPAPGSQQPIVLRLAPQPTPSQAPPSLQTPASPPTPSPQADDAQSVLARLRQLAPAPPQQETARTADQRPRPSPSSVLPRLNAARVALSNGQIEDARRLLQQVQLQLVFGPIDSPGGDTPAASKSAVEVAHALDALSANEVPLSRRYIDVAMGELSGTPSNPPLQETDRRASGYAPAYPPR